MGFSLPILTVTAQVLLITLTAPLRSSAATNDVRFNRDIRPILSENCYACHGPDKNQRKAKLRLDMREVALERGAILPGKPAESKLIQHIFSTDPDEIMPPPRTEKTLTAAQKDLLKQWIAAGANYEPHWAYIKPVRGQIPQVHNAQWVQNPIDAFVMHTLEEKGVRPSQEADLRTLLRRLSLDLVGFPPTPEQVKAFLADKRADAYERQVDRLLNSPHFGERMAVPWLDVVRFADTVGYHGDQNQNIFPYRDYVIDSFNENKPFDQFTIEQIAGDLLPNPSIDALTATGFNRLNMMTREGGAQPREYLAKYAADRVRTVSMAWLGSTMGCAECHDHKFDPFSSKDFYSMEAFFADLKQWGVYENYGYTPEPELEGIDNDGPFPPEIELDSVYLHQRLHELHGKADQVYASSSEKLKDSTAKAAFTLWRKSNQDFLQQLQDGWTAPHPLEVALHFKDTNIVAQTNFSIGPDGTIALSELPRESLKLTLPLSSKWVSAIRLEVVPQPAALEKSKPSKKRKSGRVTLSATLISGEDETRLSFFDAEADHKQERFVNGRRIVGVMDGWQLSTDHDKQFAVWILDKPLQVKEADRLVVNLGNAAIGSVRVSLSPFAAEDPLESGADATLRQALQKGIGTRDRRLQLVRTYLLSTLWDREAGTEARRLIREIRLCRHGKTLTMVSAAREQPVLTRVLPRGNWQDQSGEVVQPTAPHFLPQIPNPDGRRLTRLDLARWLVSEDNPLTARAVVNRLWKQFFGTGLSAVLDDLGVQGDWPVHPELLDWLACEFKDGPARNRKSGANHRWDVKHIIKLIVMSSTYRQDSNLRADLKEIDPNNRLLAAQTPRRLEAEFIRDNALFIAGLLNLDMGGPSVHPYQPAGYYANIQFPDRDYYPELDQRQYRRGLYMHWQRTFLHPMLANFDAPAREECTAIRVVSNTPQQALTLLNDPEFVEAARVFAGRLLLPAKKSDAQRLDSAFELALARPARDKEKASLLKFLAKQREHFQQENDEPVKLMKVGIAVPPKGIDKSELAAWTQVCRVILNLQETVTRY